MSSSTTRNRHVRSGVLLFALLFAFQVRAQSVPTSPDETPTERVAACINNASSAYGECLNDLPWYVEFLCTLKFDADVILCFLEALPV